MPKFKPRTLGQNSAIHGLLGSWGINAEEKAAMVADITKGRTESTKDMSFDEANVMIDRLGGQPFSANVAKLSRRSVNHYRQQANVPQIVTPEHLGKLNREWFKKPGRTEQGLKQLCQRILKDAQGNPLDRPRTTDECSKVIEAVKSMNKRAPKTAAA